MEYIRPKLFALTTRLNFKMQPTIREIFVLGYSTTVDERTFGKRDEVSYIFLFCTETAYCLMETVKLHRVTVFANY